jgi:hypothetical protein
MVVGRTGSGVGHDLKETRLTPASSTEACDRTLGGMVSVSAPRPSFLVFLRMCIRWWRLGCCKDSDARSTEVCPARAGRIAAEHRFGRQAGCCGWIGRASDVAVDEMAGADGAVEQCLRVEDVAGAG